MRIVERPAGDFESVPAGPVVRTVVAKDAPPPPRPPRQLRDVAGRFARPSIIGERVMIARDLSWLLDVRAVSEAYEADGTWLVDVCDEADWYAAGQDPDAVPLEKKWSVHARYVWTD